MAVDRVARIVAELDLGSRPGETLDGLCIGCARELDVTGAVIALILGDRHHGLLGTSDATASAVEDLESTFGEGPSLDAHHSGDAVFEPDLANSTRWATFAPGAVYAGTRAAFAFPLQIGEASFGALALFRNAVGHLSTPDRTDAATVADLATTLVVLMPLGDPPTAVGEHVGELIGHRAVVNQAAGMVSVQLGIAIEDAHVALRARAFSDGRALDDVATDVVTRAIRFER